MVSEATFFLKGLLLGVSIAIPVGPIGLLCIRTTLVKGFPCGVASGLGAATADALYSCVAAFGISAISAFLIENTWPLHLFGGLFLLYLGYRFFRAAPVAAVAKVKGKGLWNSYAGTFLLTLTNPLTIVFFAAIFAGLGVGGGTVLTAVLLVFGVFSGSVCWWIFLAGLVYKFRTRFDPAKIHWMQQLAGLILAGFGILSLTALVK